MCKSGAPPTPDAEVPSGCSLQISANMVKPYRPAYVLVMCIPRLNTTREGSFLNLSLGPMAHRNHSGFLEAPAPANSSILRPPVPYL